MCIRDSINPHCLSIETPTDLDEGACATRRTPARAMHAAARTIARRCARRASVSTSVARQFAVRERPSDDRRARRTRRANDDVSSEKTDDDATRATNATQAVPQGAGGATSNADEYAKIRATHANVTVREKRRVGDRAGREARDGGGRRARTTREDD